MKYMYDNANKRRRREKQKYAQATRGTLNMLNKVLETCKKTK